MSEESVMFVVTKQQMLIATGNGMSIELGKIITMHNMMPRDEILYTFTLDNGISVTLPFSRIYKEKTA